MVYRWIKSFGRNSSNKLPYKTVVVNYNLYTHTFLYNTQFDIISIFKIIADYMGRAYSLAIHIFQRKL